MGRTRTCDCGTCGKCVHRAAEARRKAAWLALTDEERAERTALYRESRDAPLEKRLWAKVDVGSLDECWPWQERSRQAPLGYGKIGDGSGSPLTVSRVICEWSFGPPPTPEHQAMHACDNPPCCNPLHLSWGTPRENNLDKSARGRATSHRRVMTDAQAAEVRARHMAGELQRELAAEFGVSQPTISKIIRGVTYGKDRP